MKKLLLILLCLPFIGFGQNFGCIDTSACNFDANATVDDGTCIYSLNIVAEIRSGEIGSYPNSFTLLDNYIYFQADDGIHGEELWKYSLNDSSLVMVVDLYFGEQGSYPYGLTVIEGDLYFSAGYYQTGRELWKYSPSNNSIIMVADINTTFNGDVGIGTYGSDPLYLTALNGNLYFSAYDGYSQELWKYSPSQNTATIATNILPYSDHPTNLKTYNNDLYYSARTGNGNGERTIYRYSPSLNNVNEVSFYPSAVIGDDIYYGVFKDPVNSDGLLDLRRYSSLYLTTTAINGVSDIEYLTVLGGDLYFKADGLGTYGELWKYSPPLNTLSLISTNFSSIKELTVYGNDLYFSAIDNISGYGLFKYSTTDSTINNVFLNGSVSVNCCRPENITSIGNDLFFSYGDSLSGAEFWRYSDCSTISSNTTISACNSYIWDVNGTEYTSSGIYTDVNINSSGFEQTQTIELFINKVVSSIYQLGENLFAISDPNGLNADWYNIQIDNGETRIWLMEEDTSSFSPTFDCSYFIVVEDENGCIDTSDIYSYGANAARIGSFVASPNPTSGLINVSFENNKNQFVMLELLNNDGTKLDEFITIENNIDIDLSQYASGTYYLHFNSKDAVQGCRLEEVQKLSTKIILNK